MSNENNDDPSRSWTYRLGSVAAVCLTVLEVKRLLLLTFEVLINSRAIRFAGALVPVLLSFFDFAVGFPIAIAIVKAIRRSKVDSDCSRVALSRLVVGLVLCGLLNTATLLLMYILRSHLDHPDRLQELFATSMDQYSSNASVKVALDELQMDLECCGYSGYADWFNIDWQGIEINADYYDYADAKRSVPFSCCDRKTLYPCIHTHMRKDDEMTINMDGCSPLIHRVILKITLLSFVMTGLILFTQIVMMILLIKIQSKISKKTPQTWHQDVHTREVAYAHDNRAYNNVVNRVYNNNNNNNDNNPPTPSGAASSTGAKSAVCSCSLLEERIQPQRARMLMQQDCETCQCTDEYDDEDEFEDEDEDEECPMTPGKLRELLCELRDDMQQPTARRKKTTKNKKLQLDRVSLTSRSYEGSSSSSEDCDF